MATMVGAPTGVVASHRTVPPFDLSARFYDFYDWADVVGATWPSRNGLLPTLTGVTKTAGVGVKVPDHSFALPANTIRGAISVSHVTLGSGGYEGAPVRMMEQNGWHQIHKIAWISPPYDDRWISATSANLPAMPIEDHHMVIGEVGMAASGFSGTEARLVAFPNTQGEVIQTGGYSGGTPNQMEILPGLFLTVRFMGVLTFSPIHSPDWSKIRDSVITKYGVTMRP